MRHVARTENLLIQEVDDELMVYDQERNTCYCLNPIAARVWHYCDGYNTVEEIAKFLEEELDISVDTDIRGLVWLALEELQSFHLIKEYLREPVVSTPTISRRKVMKRATLVSGFALGALFPMVKSLVAPEPALAVSGASNTVTCTCAGKGSVTITCTPPTKGGSCDCTGSTPVASC